MPYYTYHNIISLENLLEAWKEFLNGKRGRKDVQEFERNLMEYIISLHQDLVNKTYAHSNYHAFKIYDPKPRDIHKASVRDRLLHHALHRRLYPFFDKLFITDSFSCRIDKGTHKAMDRLKEFAYKASHNNKRTIYILKCDIRKFFANIDHRELINILQRNIPDKDTIEILSIIINSFSSNPIGKTYGVKGLPLGNLTSQLLVNIYMNEFDQFMKHKLKVKYYIRFADDFVILSESKGYLEELLSKISSFLCYRLKLSLHPDKVFIKTFASGVDFLGWVHFLKHRVLRTTTKRRMLKNIKENKNEATKQSYLGLLKHGDTYKLREEVLTEL